MDDDSPRYPIYSLPSKTAPQSSASVASGLSQRTIPETLTRDKIYRWITFRMKFNKDLLTEILSDKNVHGLHEYDSRKALSLVLRDPDTKRLGVMLKKKYCDTEAGLQESSYFVFGLPRVRRINEEIYRNFEGDVEKPSIDEKTTKEKISSTVKNEPEISVEENSNSREPDPEPIYRKSTKGPNRDLKESQGPKQENPSAILRRTSKRDEVSSTDNIYSGFIRNTTSNRPKPDLRESRRPKQENTPESKSKRSDTDGGNIYGDYIRNPLFEEPKPLRSSKKDKRGGQEMQWFEYETPMNKVDPNAVYGRSIVPDQFYFQGI